MSVPAWPPDLPQRFQRDGYSEAAADGRIRQKMEAGPPKVRRRTSAAVRPVSASVVVDDDGLARFNRFWEEEVAQGSLPFWLPAQSLDGFELGTADGDTLLADDGTPIVIVAWWLAIFGEGAPKTVQADPCSWRISFDIEVLP